MLTAAGIGLIGIAISALGVPFQDHEQGYSKNKNLSRGCAKAAIPGAIQTTARSAF